ncbi:MAG: PorV/PorQ family protein [Elusimicrobiota bacterium]|nr:PorV/PorQ family protein [Elusimicrobiota bacterium]
MKKTTYLISGLLMCAAAGTGLCANNAGTGTAAFLKLPVDARSAGMGEAVAAGARGPMALFQNPAGLADGSAALSFSHALLVEDISYDVLGAAVPLGEAGVIGAGAQYLKYGSFDSLYNNGDSAGSLSPKDTAYSLGWGMALNDDIMAGAAVKYIDSRISGSAATTAMDLGLLINGEELSVGFTAQNMGKGLKFNKESSPLPVNIKLGVNIPFREKWQWAADFNFPKDGPVWLAAGAEYAFIQKDSWTLFGRAGYNTAANDTEGINGVSAGFGLSGKKLSFDYAFRTMGMLGSTHHLGLTYRLGK